MDQGSAILCITSAQTDCECGNNAVCLTRGKQRSSTIMRKLWSERGTASDTYTVRYTACVENMHAHKVQTKILNFA